jgi:antitoxin VapB
LALNLKNPETEHLARELARRQGTSITEAVTSALRAELERERRRLPPRPVADRLLDIGRRFAALPTLDDRSAEEILGYDEVGLPR